MANTSLSVKQPNSIIIKKTYESIPVCNPEYEDFYRNYELLLYNVSIGSIVYNRLYSINERNTSAHILSIAMNYSARGDGFGGILLDRSISDLMICFPNLEEIYLHSSPNRQNFYSRHGFIPYESSDKCSNMVKFLNREAIISPTHFINERGIT